MPIDNLNVPVQTAKAAPMNVAQRVGGGIVALLICCALFTGTAVWIDRSVLAQGTWHGAGHYS